jgi:hypothetical protein
MAMLTSRVIETTTANSPNYNNVVIDARRHFISLGYVCVMCKYLQTLRRRVSPNRLLILNGLDGVIAQKAELLTSRYLRLETHIFI